MSKWLSSWESDTHRTYKLITIDKDTDNITFGFDFYNDGHNPIWDVRVGEGKDEPTNYNLFYHYFGSSLAAGINSFLYKLVLSRTVLEGEQIYIGIGVEPGNPVARSLLRNLVVNTDGGGTVL